MVEIPDDPALDLTGDFTIEAWFRLPRRQSSRSYTACIVGKGAGVHNTHKNYYLGVINRNNKINFHIGDGAGGYQELVSARSLTTNRMMHVAAVRSENSLSLYIDGVLEAEQIPRSINQVANDEPLRIGGLDDPSFRYFVAAEIDEVRIWNVAQTKKEIAQHRVVRPDTPGLVFRSKASESEF